MTAFIVIRPVEIFSPSPSSQAVATSNSDSSTQVRASYSSEDVFRATRVVLYQDNQLRMTSDEGILHRLNLSLNDSFTELSKRDVLSQSDYEQLVIRDAYGQLQFDGPVSFGIMSRYFRDLPDDLRQDTFTRIVYRYDDQRDVFFINDATKQSYHARTDMDVPAVFTSQYDESRFYVVESYMLNQTQTFIEIQPVTITKKTYLMEQIPMSFYMTQLFANTSELRNRSDGQSIIYNDNLSQLKMDRDTNVISYYQNRVDDEHLNYTAHLQQSFNQMKRLGGWQLGMSFSNYDKTSQTVEYLRYVGDFPILEGQTEGISQFVVTASGIEKMRVSSLIAQTPITSRDQSVNLMSGRDVIETLLGRGISLDTIEDIRLGYRWNLSQESNQIVEFVPDWYVRMNGTWRTIEALSSGATRVSLSNAMEGGDVNGL